MARLTKDQRVMTHYGLRQVLYQGSIELEMFDDDGKPTGEKATFRFATNDDKLRYDFLPYMLTRGGTDPVTDEPIWMNISLKTLKSVFHIWG